MTETEPFTLWYGGPGHLVALDLEAAAQAVFERGEYGPWRVDIHPDEIYPFVRKLGAGRIQLEPGSIWYYETPFGRLVLKPDPNVEPGKIVVSRLEPDYRPARMASCQCAYCGNQYAQPVDWCAGCGARRLERIQ